MSVAAIYRKTRAGERAFLDPGPRLEPRLRSLLLLVDGRRSRLDLARAFPELALSPEPLERLAAIGLIEQVPEGQLGARVVSLADYRARRGLPAATQPPSTASNTAAVFAAEIPPPHDAVLSAERQALTQFLLGELGPVGQDIEQRLARCAGRHELAQLVDEIEALLSRIAEPRLATLFARRFGSLALRRWSSGARES